MSSHQLLVNIPDVNTSSFFIPITPNASKKVSANSIQEIISEKLNCPSELFYLSSTHLIDQDVHFENSIQTIQVNFKGLGGKGGFGSMLRSQGGKMNSQQTTNFDSCRDLSGRRLKTIKDAQKLADYKEQEAELEKLKKEQIKEKIEKGMKPPAVKKVRLDDDKFIQQTKQVVSDVKSAVSTALKNKASTSQPIKTPAKRVLSRWDDESEEESGSENESGSEPNSDSDAPGK